MLTFKRNSPMQIGIGYFALGNFLRNLHGRYNVTNLAQAYHVMFKPHDRYHYMVTNESPNLWEAFESALKNAMHYVEYDVEDSEEYKHLPMLAPNVAVPAFTLYAATGALFVQYKDRYLPDVLTEFENERRDKYHKIYAPHAFFNLEQPQHWEAYLLHVAQAYQMMKKSVTKPANPFKTP